MHVIRKFVTCCRYGERAIVEQGEVLDVFRKPEATNDEDDLYNN